ncbi:TetR/AcrR family transcriptional regulator [Vibrio sp. Sgm 22]|uniref:TetR/AcrR family transcriptional regulator n=1 Tax=unclassified Vibrio TaxID=2614977 RepID=UPI0022494A3F|nr:MULTISPECIES: TetR/AcrR family transcriptional regulator [unclassified Vibrio]MCX2761036.1 TetR/AcrR family transcriptional regulator [Vibrio sp. 14G-20]MCX2777956.1 TetR/AcrR family transcriptional regulator [Vibrio sp. Sgm 22]
MLREQIAASLEVAFSQQGFAEPSVAQLKTASGVSLRTLYKHFPSKEAMIVGALEYRHQRYLDFLLEESPEAGLESVTHIFNKLQQWLEEYAPHGCMSMNAMAAFPDNALISQAVTKHKEQVRFLIGKQSLREDLATPFFLLHEGVSSAWPVLGEEAVTSAQNMVTKLLKET